MKSYQMISRGLMCLLFTVIGLSSSAIAKSKDDVIILNNGDRLTGEIKSLEHGELKFKSSYMVDSVRLNWEKVTRLESKDQYNVLLTSGQAYTAGIHLDASASESDRFQMRSGTGSVGVNQFAVLSIRPADRRFFKQLVGTIDYGFSYTSGNSQYQTQLSASATYNGEDYVASGYLTSVFNGQSEGTSTRRNNIDSQYWKLITRKWFVGGLVDLLRSDQQSLALRTTAGGAVGRKLVQTSHTSLSAFGGVALTRERYASSEERPRATSAESLLGLGFSTYRFRKLDISSRLLVLPSLTEPGRLRLGLNSDCRIELVKNFFWNLNLYENFDSRPQVRAKRNDLGITTSFGWKF